MNDEELWIQENRVERYKSSKKVIGLLQSMLYVADGSTGISVGSYSVIDLPVEIRNRIKAEFKMSLGNIIHEETSKLEGI